MGLFDRIRRNDVPASDPLSSDLNSDGEQRGPERGLLNSKASSERVEDFESPVVAFPEFDAGWYSERIGLLSASGERLDVPAVERWLMEHEESLPPYESFERALPDSPGEVRHLLRLGDDLAQSADARRRSSDPATLAARNLLVQARETEAVYGRSAAEPLVEQAAHAGEPEAMWEMRLPAERTKDWLAHNRWGDVAAIFGSIEALSTRGAERCEEADALGYVFLGAGLSLSLSRQDFGYLYDLAHEIGYVACGWEHDVVADRSLMAEIAFETYVRAFIDFQPDDQESEKASDWSAAKKDMYGQLIDYDMELLKEFARTTGGPVEAALRQEFSEWWS